jgi:uncharacterized protein
MRGGGDDGLPRDRPPGTLLPVASTCAVTVPSGGESLLKVMHVPAGPGPHPVAVLLHGFPGHERNVDLAQALRRAGYAALVFHYRGRGAWAVRGRGATSSTTPPAS